MHAVSIKILYLICKYVQFFFKSLESRCPEKHYEQGKLTSNDNIYVSVNLSTNIKQLYFNIYTYQV